jgi:hypothetical protein
MMSQQKSTFLTPLPPLPRSISGDFLSKIKADLIFKSLDLFIVSFAAFYQTFTPQLDFL